MNRAVTGHKADSIRRPIAIAQASSANGPARENDDEVLLGAAKGSHRRRICRHMHNKGLFLETFDVPCGHHDVS
ncbi:hypothetical protein ABZ917_41510 [Nonomuraea wenchangensis]